MQLFNFLNVFFTVLLFLVTPANAAETYKLDPAHSFVEWHISHFDFSHPSGKWFANGELKLDEQHPENGSANIVINVADMVTGIPKLDEHLKGNQFFDVAHFPKATFVSDKVDVQGDNTAVITGKLTLHGVTKPVTLNAKLNKMGLSAVSNKKTAGFSATANIKRSDFGINQYLPGLGDDVLLNIEVEASPVK